MTKSMLDLPQWLLRAERELDLLTVLCAAWAAPGHHSGQPDPGVDVTNGDEGLHGHEVRGRSLEPTPLGSFDAAKVVSALVSDAMQIENKILAGHDVTRCLGVVTVAVSPNDHIVSGVVAAVGQLEQPVVFPSEIPVDIVALNGSGLVAASYEVRLLSQLVSVYRDAVRLAGDGVRFPGEFVGSLGLLQSRLRDAIRFASPRYRQPCSSAGGRGDTQRQPINHEPIQTEDNPQRWNR